MATTCVAACWLFTPLFAHAFQNSEPSTVDSKSDWLRIAPGDARFYAEFRDLAGVRMHFRKLGIWDIVRELSEAQPRGATTQPWHRKAEQFLGMDADAAIDKVVGRRSALIASEPSEWQNGVMLAELSKSEDLAALLKQWKAKPLSDEGPVARYMLAGGLMLAALDKTIALGPPDDPEGLWGRTVLLMSGRRGPSLSGRSEFASLRSRLSGDYQGVLYVTWPEGDPTAVAGCSRLLAGVTLRGANVHCELHGQRSKPTEPEKPCDLESLQSLPPSTVAAFGGTIDFDALQRRTSFGEADQAFSLLGFMVAALSSTDDQPERLVNKLGPAYTIVVSRGSRSKSREGIPAFALIVPTRDGSHHMQALDGALGLLAQFTAAITASQPDEVPEVPIRKNEVLGVDVHSVDIGPALAKRLGLPILARMDLCWFVDRERLVVSTSQSQAWEIIRSGTAKEVRLNALAGTSSGTARSDPANMPCNVLFLSGVPVSRMLGSWLAQLQEKEPEMLSATWWRDWAAKRLDRFTRLGIALEPDRTSPVRAIVREIEPTSPALDYLRPGDIIIGAAGRALSTTKPAQEVAQRYKDRGQSRRFEVRLIRGGETIDLTIPVQPTDPVELTGFDPVQVLRQLIVLTRKVDTLKVRRFIGAPDRLDAEVDIRWSFAP